MRTHASVAPSNPRRCVAGAIFVIFMKNWTLQKRIAFGFAVLCFALVTLGGFTVYQLRLAAGDADALSQLHTKQGGLAGEILSTASDLAIATRGFDVAGTEENWKKVQTEQGLTETAITRGEAFGRLHPELRELNEGLAKARPTFNRYTQSAGAFHAAVIEFQ